MIVDYSLSDRKKVTKIVVNCEDYSREYSIGVSDEESIEKASIDAICCDIAWEYDDIFEEAQDGYSYPSDEECVISRIARDFSSAIKHCIDEYTRDVIVQIRELDEDGDTACSFEVALNEVLDRAVDLQFENSYNYVANVVEGYLYNIKAEGKWRFGLIHRGSVVSDTSLLPEELVLSEDFDYADYKPIFWFSTSNKIVKPWIIYWNMKLEEFKFWHESDPWLSMQYIIGQKDEPFLGEYLWEKANEAPDNITILEKCPIRFSATDSVEDINRKLKEYFRAWFRREPTSNPA